MARGTRPLRDKPVVRGLDSNTRFMTLGDDSDVAMGCKKSAKQGGKCNGVERRWGGQAKERRGERSEARGCDHEHAQRLCDGPRGQLSERGRG